jgi:predicted Zn-dependent protease with MMP-like domain
LTEDSFRKLVAKAIDDLPDEFREKLDNVEIIIEDFPDHETMRSMNLGSKWDLLGLYVGAPITHKSVFSVPYLPERIYLYRHPIIMAAGSPRRIPRAIRDVLIHEIGHHFGFGERELEEMNEDF